MKSEGAQQNGIGGGCSAADGYFLGKAAADTFVNGRADGEKKQIRLLRQGTGKKQRARAYRDT